MASAAAKARTAAALALYLKGQKEVAELKAKLKLAQSKTLAAGTLYQRAIVAEEKERVAALAPAMVARPSKKTPTKTAKMAAVSAKVAVCRPFVPVKRGRPTDGSCNACKRRLMGLKGGKAHTCGRPRYARFG